MVVAQSRDNSVTIVKAIAIILMVLGHSGSSRYVDNFIFMFHMPVFYFMSGYCFKESHLNNARTFITKRIKGAWLPYIKWGGGFLLMHNVFLRLNILSSSIPFHGKVQHYYSINETFKHLGKNFLMTDAEQLLGGFWFLKSLFWGSLIFFLTRKIITNRFYGACVLLLITILLSFVKFKVPAIHIGSIDFFAAFFIMIGNVCHSDLCEGDNDCTLMKYCCSKYLALFSVVVIMIGSVLWPSSMLSFTWKNAFQYSITAIMGSLMLLYCGRSIDGLKKKFGDKLYSFLIYCGNHSLDILIWHFLSMKVATLIIIGIYNLPIELLGSFPNISEYSCQGWWVLYLTVGVGLPLGLIYMIERIKTVKKNFK